MKERDIDIVVAGHICLDIIPEFASGKGGRIEDIFKPGKLINVESVAISTGGSVPNTGLALHRLGGKVEFMGKIGRDSFGEIILEKLRQTVATDGMRVMEGENTSYTIVLAPPGIDRMFLHNSGANDTFGYEDINFDLVEKAKHFHLGYPSLMRRLYENEGEQLAKIYRKAKGLGTTTSLDVALPDINSPSGKVNWPLILKNVLPYVDIFLPSGEEILYMLEKEEYQRRLMTSEDHDILTQLEGQDLTRLSDKMLELGTKAAVIKCGYRGFYIRTAQKDKFSRAGSTPWSGRELWEPVYYVEKIASATGAGDSAIAGFLLAYLKGETIEMCIKYACMAGAQNVRVLDAVSGIKSWKETTHQIEKNPEKDSLNITTSGWQFDEESKVWIGPNDRRNY